MKVPFEYKLNVSKARQFPGILHTPNESLDSLLYTLKLSKKFVSQNFLKKSLFRSQKSLKRFWCKKSSSVFYSSRLLTKKIIFLLGSWSACVKMFLFFLLDWFILDQRLISLNCHDRFFTKKIQYSGISFRILNSGQYYDFMFKVTKFPIYVDFLLISFENLRWKSSN